MGGQKGLVIHPLRHLATENHIRFLASYENNFKDLTTELKLPIAENKLQEILDYNFRKNDDDWLQERLPDIRQLIEKPKKEDFIIWIRACNVYLFMIDNFYVEGDTSKFVSHVEDRLGIFEFSASDDLEELRRDLKYYVHDKKLTELFSQFLSDTAKSEKNSKIESYKQRFRESWQLVVEESRFEHHDRFLQYFESEDFDYILEHWSNKDISDFVRFIRSRFNVVDCSEVYGQDKAPIESLLGSINLRRRQLPKGA